jgi:hypothetical protein
MHEQRSTNGYFVFRRDEVTREASADGSEGKYEMEATLGVAARPWPQ